MNELKIFSITALIALVLIIGCAEDSISKRDKEAAKVEKEQVETPTEPQTATVYYEPAPLSDDGNSYWFVVVETKTNTYKINKVVKQNHRWFSFKEAKAEFKDDVFILNVVQVSKETYEND